MSPSLLMEIVMFSVLRLRDDVALLGSSMGTCWMTTGIVIRKMMSSTSITSTSGVVLMADMTSWSSSASWPTVMAMGVRPLPSWSGRSS